MNDSVNNTNNSEQSVVTNTVNPNSVPVNPTGVPPVTGAYGNTVSLTSSQNSVNNNSNSNVSTFSDNISHATVDPNLKKVEINYTPPSKFKTFLLIFFFGALIAFVIFLPEITSLVNQYKSGKYNYQEEVITTGKLNCTLETTTTNLDKEYDLIFQFTDKKLEKTQFSITTRGDPTLDEVVLDELAATCMQLAENVENLEGISVRCSYLDGKLVEEQTFNLLTMNPEEVDAAFIEAGGNNPEYQAGQDIDYIERTMNASGYTCKREK